ncbi:MAG: UDP-N-acetylmuramoyl-L-alanyl-D-glutamate--2,6-diaminopimelate ligase [Brevinema sp.]
MKLSALFLYQNIEQDIDIIDITNDSRKAVSNTLFIAHTGFEKDLHQYISNAYQNGCRHFLIDKSRLHEFDYLDALFITTKNLKKEATRIIHTFFNHPDKDMFLIGITGTNGKTTTATLINKALHTLGQKTAFFGTVEWIIGSENLNAPNTTPDLIDLMRFLRKAVDQGIKYLVMEVASHALSLGRVEDLAFDAVCFTNLTQDHLDYHGDFEHYFDAKKYLFTHLLAQSSKSSKKAFINIDDPYGKRLADILSKDHIDFDSLSLESNASYYVDQVEQSTIATKFIIHESDQKITTTSTLLGLFNVYNFMMAYMVLRYIGFDKDVTLNALQNISVSGRLEKYISPNQVTFLIDYAHTPDALDKAIETIQKTLSSGYKSIVVFGAGGDRDPLKRPLMAQSASKADIVIVTSDNPRTEDPQKIIDQVIKGFLDLSSVYQEINRSKAIQLAYDLARPGDVILIAGKGHENYQVIGTQKIDFSDLEEVKKVSKKLSK